MSDPIAVALLGLLGAIALGAVTMALGLFPDREAAIAALNALGIRVAFPALVVASIARAPDASTLGWLIGPIALVLALGLVVVGTRLSVVVRQEGPVLALVVAFGNTAYLGVPLATALVSDAHAGDVAVAATAHVAVAVTAGPLLLARLAGKNGGDATKRALMQPLFLALPLGLALRFTPTAVRDPVVALLGPIGSVAAPVGAFVLGAYLALHRASLARLDAGVLLHAAARLLLVPVLALGVAEGMRGAGLVSDADVRIALLLAAMPAAISTFAIAKEEGHGDARAAHAIVVTSVLSLVTVPLWLAVLERMH